MRRTLIVGLLVVALAAGVVAAGASAVDIAVRRSAAQLEQAARAARRRDGVQAARSIEALIEDWRHQTRALELLITHDALYDVVDALEDAALCVEYGDRGECMRALRKAGAALERIRAAEAVRLANLF